MIGGALVGTFLGVFLAYGLVGPIAARLNQTYGQDGQFYAIIRDCLVAHLHGHAAPIAVELARGNVPTILQPSFQELDEVLGKLPSDPLAACAVAGASRGRWSSGAWSRKATAAITAAPGRWPTPIS